MNNKKDHTLEYLLELDGTKFVVDEQRGIWVKFEATRVVPSKHRAHGIKYSLSLHDRNNRRLMGFDNAHAIKYGQKTNVSAKRTYDHWHRDEADKGRPYKFVNAEKLLQDFWLAVDNKIAFLREHAYDTNIKKSKNRHHAT